MLRNLRLLLNIPLLNIPIEISHRQTWAPVSANLAVELWWQWKVCYASVGRVERIVLLSLGYSITPQVCSKWMRTVFAITWVFGWQWHKKFKLDKQFQRVETFGLFRPRNAYFLKISYNILSHDKVEVSPVIAMQAVITVAVLDGRYMSGIG